MSAYATTFYGDGMVRVWNVYEQQWNKTHASTLVDLAGFNNAVLPTLPQAERDRVKSMAAQFGDDDGYDD